MANTPSAHAYFYNSEDGDRVYDADSMVDWLYPFFTTGVFNGGCQVTANNDMTASVATGYVNVEGKVKNFFGASTVTFDTAHSEYPRIDIVVVRRDDAERVITIEVVKGTASETPVAPSLTRNSEIYELQLCSVAIGAGVTAITQADITDTRMDSAVCGWVVATVDEIDFSQITAQFNTFLAQYRASLESEADDIIDTLTQFEQGAESQFTTWFNALKAQFTQDAVGQMQAAITDLDERVAYLEEHGGGGGTATITGISVTTPPTKTSYNAGETLNLTGMVVKVNYSDGNSTIVNSGDYTTVPANGATLTTQNTSVQISYVHGENTYRTTQAITVSDVLSSIAFTTQPTKTTYTEGDTLDLTGAVVTATYVSGQKANVTTSCAFSPANGATLSTVGTQTVTATYIEGGVTKTAIVSVEVSSASFTYSALLDLTNSDPAACVSYADDASGMSKGWDAWKNTDLFKSIKPCVLKDGEVLYYLNPDNYAQKADGTAADITTLGNDVMIEIPKMGYAIEWQDNDKTQLKVSVTDEPNASGFSYDAFSLDANNDCDKLYIGAYKASANENMLYSSSGKTPFSHNSISVSRSYARARGTGYQQRTFGSLKLMQCLYIIAHGNLDSQTSVGMGYVDGNTAAINTGGANALGFDYELASSTQKTSGKTQVKCLGLEDFWGNVQEWIDGLITDENQNILHAQYASQISDTGAGYANIGNGGVTENIYGVMVRPVGDSGAGFVTAAKENTFTDFFCDLATFYRSMHVALFGGHWNRGVEAGAFCLYLSNATGTTGAQGGRLIYLHKAV